MDAPHEFGKGALVPGSWNVFSYESLRRCGTLLSILFGFESNAIKGVNNAGGNISQMGTNPFKPAKIHGQRDGIAATIDDMRAEHPP
jgi:hypothetical protein